MNKPAEIKVVRIGNGYLKHLNKWDEPVLTSVVARAQLFGASDTIAEIIGSQDSAEAVAKKWGGESMIILSETGDDEDRTIYREGGVPYAVRIDGVLYDIAKHEEVRDDE
jgi:predicted SpoU family rRNA methylase